MPSCILLILPEKMWSCWCNLWLGVFTYVHVWVFSASTVFIPSSYFILLIFPEKMWSCWCNLWLGVFTYVHVWVFRQALFSYKSSPDLLVHKWMKCTARQREVTWCGRRSWLRLLMAVVMLSISSSTEDCNCTAFQPWRSLSGTKLMKTLVVEMLYYCNLLGYMKCSVSLLTSKSHG